MARIADAELERIKSEVSLERLAEARGVKLKKLGHDLRGRCPFHGPDEDPSLSIDPAKNVFHCFGCGAKGSVVDWVMQAEGVSFRHAVELLRNDVAVGPTGRRRPERLPPKASTIPKLPAPVALDAAGYELLEQVVSYYHQTLLGSPVALEYLRERGLTDPALVTTFRLGYANRTLGLRLPQKSRAAGAEIRGRLQQLGIYRETGREHFNGCITWPTFDPDGRVVGLYGRKITKGLKPSIPRHLYLPGPRRGVWNFQALFASSELVLCESHIDAATFWCAGLRHVTTAWGCRGLTEEHVEAFARHGIERVLVAFDRDEPGEEAARAAAERLLAAGIACYRVEFPRGMDANEYALKVGPAGKSLALVLRHARWLGKGRSPERSGPGSEATTRPAETPAGPAALAAGDDPGATEDSATSPATSPPELPTKTAVPALAPPAASQEPIAARSLSLAASPEPPAPAAPEVPAERGEHEVVIRLGPRRWRVRGLDKNLSYDLLKVNLLVATDTGFHVDTFDLYSARHRGSFLRQAAEELRLEEPVLKADLARVLLELEELQDEQIRRVLEGDEEPTVTIAESAKREALELLADPHLVERLGEDLERCGVVGEESNKLVAYLACVSRKLERPLAVLVQSSSAAGKSTLMDAVLELVPEEERVAYSAMTGQALFYMDGIDLRHKVLAIAEEEGAERAAYALKLLQSEGELTIASTGKDPQTGRLVTQEYRVEGPVAILSTTTAIDLDPEFLNRCLVLAVDESREQTRAIHRYQRRRRTLEGFVEAQQRHHLRELHRNAQRLLRPLPVLNPFAERLTFLDESTRTRRDHEKYLTLIDALALLHQYQRERRRVPVWRESEWRESEAVVVALADVALANSLAAEALGRSLDELPPQTRRLLELIEAMVEAGCRAQAVDRARFRFGRRDVCAATGWSYDQVRVHLERLVDQEFVVLHHGGRGQPCVYELLYDGAGKAGERFVIGLLDVERLAADGATTARLGGTKVGVGGPLGVHRAASGGGLASGSNGHEPSNGRALVACDPAAAEIARPGAANGTSRRKGSRPPFLAASARQGDA